MRSVLPGEVFPGLTLARTPEVGAHIIVSLNLPVRVPAPRAVVFTVRDLGKKADRISLMRAVREVKIALARRRRVLLVADPEQLARFTAALAIRHMTGFGPNVVAAMLADRGVPLTTLEYVSALQRTQVTRVPSRGS
jgi:hypothetical protein